MPSLQPLVRPSHGWGYRLRDASASATLAASAFPQSAESISTIRKDGKLEKQYELVGKKNNYYNGVFTYNFTEIINWLIKNNKEITIENIFVDSIWNTISIISGQSYQIKK